jgi:hypothetical protein
MDTLFWDNLKSDIAIENTIKQFYNRYLWRLVIHAEGGKLALAKNNDLAQELDRRKSAVAFRTAYSQIWSFKQCKFEQVNLNLLRTVRKIKNDFAGSIKVRVEEPYIQFYTEDEATLKTLALKIDPQYIKSITVPEPSTVSLLQSGAILNRVPTAYNYKVIVGNGRYDIQTKQQLLNYLDNLGDNVKLSKTGREMLERPHTYVWGLFFYVQDISITTFISLINPRLISNIHRMANVSN